MQVKQCISSLLFCLFSITSYGQTVIQGKITDEDGVVVGAAIQLFQDNNQIKIVSSDFDGDYLFIVETAGKHALHISSIGNSAMHIKNIHVVENTTSKVDVNLNSAEGLYDKVTIMEYKVPLISFDICCSSGLRASTSSLPSQFEISKLTLQLNVKDLPRDMHLKTFDSLPIAPYTLQPHQFNQHIGEKNRDNNIQIRIPPKAKLDSLSIYPNPVFTNNRFTVKTSSEFDEFQLFSMNGQLISNGKFEAVKEFEIIAPDAAGMYAIRLLFENEQLIAIGSVVVIR